MTRTSWSELSDRRKTAILVLVSAELSLTATALVDLVRRPVEQVRGRKAIWAAGLLMQPVGPIAYLAWGARRPASA
jgi:hypothetical protein